MKTISFEQRVRLALDDSDFAGAIDALVLTGDISDDLAELIEDHAKVICGKRLIAAGEDDHE